MIRALFSAVLLLSGSLICTVSADSGIRPEKRQYRERIDLSGEWNTPLGICTLPGTTDESRLGPGLGDTTVTGNLSRLFPYSGRLRYGKTVNIPEGFADGKRLRLVMERTRPSTLYIDNDSIGRCGLLLVPHIYDLHSLSPGDSAAKAAVDIALHDLVGKLLQTPWYKLWGLNKEKTPDTTYTIGIDTPDVVRQKTRECAERFNILKVKLGRDNDKEMIQTIRSVTDLPIAVDANQGWTDKAYALDMIHWLKEQGVVMVEQPMPKERMEDIAWVTAQSPLPVFADEAVQRLKDIPTLKDVYTGINIKLMKCTGMREAWKMVTLARALDMRVMVGCMTETSCGISAASQFSPAVDFADLDGNLLIANDRFRGVEVVKGKITLPDLPGIGVVKV